ncbi:MAG: outer membrane protein assembly factor BamA, partial [Candidatus Omnitrophica bacterium]|nr:outer membrane protein assembly factor BamA [Candidatus Omnitrophota bacterium]
MIAGVIGAVLIFGGTACVFAQASASSTQQSGTKIAAIKISGNNAISTETILNRIKIQPGDTFEESALNKEIKRLFATGYFNDVSVGVQQMPEGIVVVFTVVEKPLIEKITFRGNARIKSPKLEKKVTIKAGDLLDQHMLAQNAADIKAFYVEQGYSNVNVDYELEQGEEPGKAIVVFVVDEGHPIKVKKITFEGNKSIPAAELGKYMSTKTAWWFIRKGAYSEEQFQGDLERVVSVYRAKGFLDATTSSDADYSEDGSEMYLKVIVKEGKQYQVGEVSITGELAFDEGEIWRTIKTRQGDPFDQRKLKDDVESVRAFYYHRGYMNAEIDLKRKYNSKSGMMDMNFEIEAHEEVYVGQINVIGNTKTKDKVVRRELRVYPGEKFDGDKLKRSKERIYNLGFFEDVYFETVESDTDDPNIKDLNVTVKETKTGEFSFGGGYSSVDAWIGFAQIRQKNFDLLSFPTFSGGGQDLTIRAEIGTVRQTYFLGWQDPWIFDFPYMFGFDVYRQQHDRDGLSGYGYDETRTGGDLKLGKELTEELYTGLNYNLEEVKISNPPDDATQDLIKEVGSNWISKITWNIQFDKRDNKFSPTKGFVTSLALENAGGMIGGDKDFVKGFWSGSYYHSFFEIFVLELQGRTGLAENYGKSDDVPIYERFFA